MELVDLNLHCHLWDSIGHIDKKKQEEKCKHYEQKTNNICWRLVTEKKKI